MGTVLVYLEARSGAISPASVQLFTLARELAGDGGTVQAVVIGSGVSGAARSAATGNASVVQVAESPEFEHYHAERYRDALCAAITASGADIVLMATTACGRDVAPRVAARVGAYLATDCVGVKMNSDGSIRVQRPQYSGKCMAEFLMPAGRVRMLSVRGNTFAGAKTGNGPQPELRSVVVASGKSASRVTGVVGAAAGVKDVAEADIIVAGGRSLKSEENFKILQELASVIGGVVGATRAAVDAGYQPHAKQIGLTGKTVSPRLYIGCGVHGAIQHLAGMRGSRVIVAINTNRDAPLFEVATYGCVADLFELVPALTRELRGGGSV